MSSRSAAQLGSMVSVCGMSWTGSVSLVLDAALMESSFFVRSSSHLALLTSALQFATLDFSMSLHSFSRLDFTAPAIGLSRLGPVSLLFVVETARFGFLMSTRSLAWIGFALSALDFLHLGFLLFLRSFVQLGTTQPAIGVCNLGSSQSAPDLVQLGSSSFIRSFA